MLYPLSYEGGWGPARVSRHAGEARRGSGSRVQVWRVRFARVGAGAVQQYPLVTVGDAQRGADLVSPAPGAAPVRSAPSAC